jgi:hypothetical protein
MGVPTSEVGYTSATTGRRNDEVHKGHGMTLANKHYKYKLICPTFCTLPHRNQVRASLRMPIQSFSYVVLTRHLGILCNEIQPDALFILHYHGKFPS